MPRLIIALGLMGLVGCASNRQMAQQSTTVSGSQAMARTAPAKLSRTAPAARNGQKSKAATNGSMVRHVAYAEAADDSFAVAHSLTAFDSGDISSRNFPSAPTQQTPPTPLPIGDGSLAEREFPNPQPADLVELNLPSVLAMIDGQHPAVGFAQWRVQEAYAQLARAQVLWLPSIQAGFSFHRHDGNYQASDGTIVDVNRNSFQYGLGTGATGAGTTPRPGLIARFHVADAIFQPKVAERTAWARGHAVKAVVNEQLLTAATAYIELLDAHQDARILEESRERTSQLTKITDDFAAAGEGLRADANRMQTELELVDNRMVGARERIAVASARLAQALSLDGGREVLPLDVTAVPLDLVSTETARATLISTGLATRPELKESQALVAVACEAFRREKYAPFVPSMLLGFSTGGFGGGLGNKLDNIDSRYDFDALISWEVRNLGFAERAVRREACARIQQAKFEKIRVMDQVAREISEAYSQVQFRREQMSITQRAIQSAQSAYDLNLARIRDGQGLPLEVLQSVQALESTRRAYLRAVVDHNQAQFRLQWALGWPVSAPEQSF